VPVPGPAEPAAGAAERLGARQAALVRALVAGGAVPAGFDPERVAATVAALARKRAREVARQWPALAYQLGEDFGGRFGAYAAANPRPRGGALADGLAFARTLERVGQLAGEARAERLIAQARLARGPFAGAVLVGRGGSFRRLVAVVRAPLLGERWLQVPLARPGRQRPPH
jgi:hypothetical protein